MYNRTLYAIILTEFLTFVEINKHLWKPFCLLIHAEKRVLYVNSEKDSDKIWNNFTSYFGFNRGDTCIQTAVEEALVMINTGSLKTKNNGEIKLKGVHPEICVIHDGEDYVEASFKPKIPLHIFIVGHSHNTLRQIAINTHGSYNQY